MLAHGSSHVCRTLQSARCSQHARVRHCRRRTQRRRGLTRLRPRASTDDVNRSLQSQPQPPLETWTTSTAMTTTAARARDRTYRNCRRCCARRPSIVTCSRGPTSMVVAPSHDAATRDSKASVRSREPATAHTQRTRFAVFSGLATLQHVAGDDLHSSVSDVKRCHRGAEHAMHTAPPCLAQLRNGDGRPLQRHAVVRAADHERGDARRGRRRRQREVTRDDLADAINGCARATQQAARHR